MKSSISTYFLAVLVLLSTATSSFAIPESCQDNQTLESFADWLRKENVTRTKRWWEINLGDFGRQVWMQSPVSASTLELMNDQQAKYLDREWDKFAEEMDIDCQ